MHHILNMLGFDFVWANSPSLLEVVQDTQVQQHDPEYLQGRTRTFDRGDTQALQQDSKVLQPFIITYEEREHKRQV